MQGMKQQRWRGHLVWVFLGGLAADAAAAEQLPALRVSPGLLSPPLPAAASVTSSPASPVSPPEPEASPAKAAAPLAAPGPRLLDPVSASGQTSQPSQKTRAASQPSVAAVPAAKTETVQPSLPVATRPQPAATTGAEAGTVKPETASQPIVRLDARPEPESEAKPEAKSGAQVEPATKPETGVTGAEAVYIKADQIHGRDEVETVAAGNVEMERIGSTLTADHLTYWPLDDEMEAVGNVHLVRDQDEISGPRMRLKVQENLGFFEQPTYQITRLPPLGGAAASRQPVTGAGEAERIDFEGEGLYRLLGATYSTCKPPNRDWYARTEELSLDYNREEGEARKATLMFKDTPILYAPWIGFSLNNQRKSGLLAPTFGSTSNSGMELTVPWYWNIAPNMDATISPRVMARRGLQLNTEFRYLQSSYNGIARVEYLPKDNITGERRDAYSLQHYQDLGHGFSGSINVNGASDNTYFTDLSSRLSVVSQTNLLRQGTLSYGGGWWNASLTAQRYQTLQDPAAPVAVPYYRLPQLLVSAARPDLPLGMNFNFTGEYVNFSHPTDVTGKRLLLYPQLSLPLQTAAFFVTPKVGAHLTRYNLSQQATGVPDQISRSLPMASVDAGMVLERSVDWFDHAVTQTLEPRLFYLYVPSRDQSQIPVFDSANVDFNFAQIFSENRYGGSDRIGDANQVTAAVVSRLIDPNTGAEMMRAALGERFYFSDQQVTLPGETPRGDRKTDVLAALSGRVLPRTYLDLGWQYSPAFSRTERLNVGGRYQPETGKVFNAGYRYTRDQLGQVDFSGQWPLFGGWYGVGRYNYSTKENRVIESLGGLEYDGGCWVLRLVAQRLATQTSKATSSFFVQLELNGFARIGSNPLDMLKRSVPGYGVINQPTADPVFGAN